MIRGIRPVWFIVIGCVLLVLGVVISLFMVIRLVEPSFLLSFLAYAASMAGLLLGIIGLAYSQT